MKQNKKQEIIDKYDIQQGKQFEFEYILRMLLVDNLDQNQRNVLDQQLIQQYCEDYYIETDNITPEFQDNDDKYTLAMWITKCDQMIPRQWMHNYDIKNNEGKTLKDMIIIQQFPLPQHWNDDNMNQFDQAYFGIVPDINSYSPDQQDEYGFTVAMILVYNNIKIPKCWYHNSSIQNCYGYTVAMIQARKERIPSKQWQHYPTMQQNTGNTVAMILAINGIIPPKQWYHDSLIQNNKNYTVAMLISQFCRKIPNKHWNHDPNLQNYLGRTVAMNIIFYHYNLSQSFWICGSMPQDDYVISTSSSLSSLSPSQSSSSLSIASTTSQTTLAQILPPPQWYHNPQLRDHLGNTVAMYIVSIYHRLPPQQWHHDPLIKNNQNSTIAILLSEFNIIPPVEWLHDPNLKNNFNQSINSLLSKHNRIFIDQKLVLNCKTEILNQKCQICFKEAKIEFLVTKCKHQICVDCYRILIDNGNDEMCPVCGLTGLVDRIVNDEL